MGEWWTRLTLITIGFIIGIVTLEFGLNIFAPSPSIPKRMFLQPDRYTGYKGIPNMEGTWREGKIESYVKMNSLGFRDDEYGYGKNEGVFRIVVLGDSFTLGLQVELDKTYHSILENKLNSSGNGTFEVINLGLDGFSTGQQYLAFKHYGLKYQPDLVILAFFIRNDVRENSLWLSSLLAGKSIDQFKRYHPFFVLNDGKLEELPFEVKVGRSNRNTEQNRGVRSLPVRFFPNIYYSLREWAGETLWLADSLWKLGIKKSGPVNQSELKKNRIRNRILMDSNVYAEEYTPEWRDAWEVTKALILKLAQELEMDKIKFLVVVIPDEREFRPDRWDRILKEYPYLKHFKFDLRKPEHILSGFLEANNISYLLLRPEFEKYSQETGKDLHFHYSYDNHWNTNGHELAARLIYEKLRDDQLVPVTKQNIID